MVGRGRQKIELKLIEKKKSRLVCFSKRRTGLFKKASELSILTDAKTGVIAFSPAGKLFAMDAPTLDSLIGCQMEKESNPSMESEYVDVGHGKETTFWWDIPQVKDMSIEELLQFERAMLEYGEQKFQNCDRQLLPEQQRQGSNEQILMDSDPINSNSLPVEVDMPSTPFDPTLVYDEQWLQWLEEWMMDA